MFVRRENFQEFIHYYPVVTALVAVNSLFFLASFFPPVYQYIYHYGVGSNFHVANGEYWRLLSPVFLHGGTAHFIFNNFALVIFGPALEIMLGRWKYLAVYLAAGILGNVGTFFAAGQNYTHLGASGAIYGLLGLYLYLALYRQDLIDPQSGQVIKVMLVAGVVYSFLMPNINYYAHLFGFIAGFGAGRLVFPMGQQRNGKGKIKKRPRRLKKNVTPGENKVISFDLDRRFKEKEKKNNLH